MTLDPEIRQALHAVVTARGYVFIASEMNIDQKLLHDLISGADVTPEAAKHAKSWADDRLRD